MKDYREEIINAMGDVCGKARQEGYEQGFKDGFQECVHECDRGYDKGLSDAWECARKLIEIEYEKAHDVWDATFILSKYSVSEAMTKIKEYKEKQEQTGKSCVTCGYHTFDEVMEENPYNTKALKIDKNNDVKR